MMKTVLLGSVVALSVAIAVAVGGLPLTTPWYRAYALRVLRHKLAVWQAGLRVGGVPWTRLLLHDLSKFSRAEFRPYAEWFCHRVDRDIQPSEWALQQRAFLAAMTHHIRTNDHHWEYWTLDGRYDGDLDLDDMPVVACREMVADWMAASKVYDGRWPTTESWPWLASSWHRITLSPLTYERVRTVLRELNLWQAALEPGRVL